MSKSPLEAYKQLLKSYEVKTDENDSLQLLTHARSQKEQIAAALRRELVEQIISQHQVDTATDNVMKSQHQSKVSEHELLAKQFVRSVDVLDKLVKELEKEVTD